MQFAQEKEYVALKNIAMQRIDEFRALAHQEQEDVIKYAILNIAFYLEDGLSTSHSKDYFTDIQRMLNNNLRILQETSVSLLQLAHAVIDVAFACLTHIEIYSTPLFNRHGH